MYRLTATPVHSPPSTHCCHMAHRLSYCDTFVTNAEVLHMLSKKHASEVTDFHQKVSFAGRSFPRAGLLSCPLQLGYYLKMHTSIGLRQSATLQEYARALPRGLSTEEKVMIVNHQPCCPIDIHVLVEDCDARFSEAEVDELVNTLGLALQGYLLGHGRQQRGLCSRCTKRLSAFSLLHANSLRFYSAVPTPQEEII